MLADSPGDSAYVKECTDKAIASLRRADETGYKSRRPLESNANLRPSRSHPEFAALIKKLK